MMQVLKAEDAVYGGYVISRHDGVVFVKGAIPGEVVEVSLKEKKRDYSVAEVTDIIEPSAYRVKPECPYFGECGGCHLQYIAYEKQVEMKNRVLVDCLKRIGNVEMELLPPIAGPQFRYRHRAQFKVSREGRIGFYREASRDVVPIRKCPLMKDEINSALDKLMSLDFSGIKEIHVTSGDDISALIKGVGFDEQRAEAFIGAGFSCVAFEDESYRGSGYVTFDLNGLIYTVSPWSFFQSNWNLNLELVRLIGHGLKPLEGKRITDLYAGAGNFSLTLAPLAKSVVAVEENPHAMTDGQRNASLNKIRNYKYARGSAENARLSGDFDIVVLDPPRPGLTNAAMNRVFEMSPEKIAYVSCNPSTFARDLRKLKEMYEIDSVRMIDMFPNTYHLESLAFLSKKEVVSA